MTEQTEIERALRAVRDADWRQVILNGGPPCFHFEQERQLFCLRAERWAGHGKAHLFVPLESLLSAMQKQAVFGAYAAAAKHFPYFRDGEWKSCRCGWKATYAAPLIYCQKDFTDQYAQHILALTPADARQARCQGCGGPHPFDTSVPSEKWNVVIRAKNLPEFLCLTCIVREFVKAGQDFTAELWGESFNGAPIAVSNNPAAIVSAEARARLEEAKWWKGRAFYGHLTDCSFNNSDGPNGDYCDCRRRERREEIEQHWNEIVAAARTPDSTGGGQS